MGGLGGGLGGGEGGEGGSMGGGMGGKMGRCTSTDNASSPRLRSAATADRTCSAARLPLSRASASSVPPLCVTDTTTSTPWKDALVTATPVLLRAGISAARLPLVSGRASTTLLVPATLCSWRRRRPVSSVQSAEVAWQAATRRAASSAGSSPGPTVNPTSHVCVTVTELLASLSAARLPALATICSALRLAAVSPSETPSRTSTANALGANGGGDGGGEMPTLTVYMEMELSNI